MNVTKQILHEDWAAVICASICIFLIVLGVQPILPAFSWISLHDLGKITSMSLFNSLVLLLAFTTLVTWIGLRLKGDEVSVPQLLGGFTTLFVITLLAQMITGNNSIKNLGLEVVLFSLLTGLFISNVLRVPAFMKPIIQTEFFIKTGLVLLGCGIIFGDVMKAGAMGLVQSVAVVFVVWQVSYWICKRMKLHDEMRTMLSSAVAICGVSAAIATAGVIKGDSKKLSYVISLVLITAIPMMLFMPYAAKAMALSPAVAGAWLGGTIDTTGAVVAAGTVLGEEALKYATVVKFSQNVLLGIAAFLISVYWMYRKKDQQERPSVKLLWDRFPKFVVGFVLASMIFSWLIPAEIISVTKSSLKGLQTFWFAIAFTCIGLETRFNDIFSIDNGKPAFAFLLAQLFNIGFTLLISWLVFGQP